MKRTLILVVLLLTACASDPTARWAQQRVALTGAQDLMVVANSTGRLSDADLVKAAPFVQSVRDALTLAETYLPEGGPSFDLLLDFCDSLTTRLSALDVAHLPEPTHAGTPGHP